MGDKKDLVGVPTMKGMGASFADFGMGAVGGLIFMVALRLFGALGVIAAPLIAGSMIKGDRGKTISTMAGFMIIALGAFALAGGGGGAESGDM